MVEKTVLAMTLNGEKVEVPVKPSVLLVDVLREEIRLTGTKEACGRGECGACTILLDGRTVNACITPALHAMGKEVWTIEGLGAPGKLHPIQEAFIEQGAVQCGYCTPGMILATKALLDQNPNPTEQEVRLGLSGNLCRCTGYVKIVKAVQVAAQRLKK